MHERVKRFSSPSEWEESLRAIAMGDFKESSKPLSALHVTTLAHNVGCLSPYRSSMAAVGGRSEYLGIQNLVECFSKGSALVSFRFRYPFEER